MSLNERVKIEQDQFSLEEITDQSMWLIQWGSGSHAPTVTSPENIDFSSEINKII